MRRALCLGFPMLLVLACSSKTETRGQLMLSMQTDLSLPKDVDTVRIEVSTFGKVNFAQDYPVGPNGAKIPATLGVLAGSDKAAPVRIRIIAKLGGSTGTARLLREAVTTVPAGRIANLRMPLQYLSLGQVVQTGSGTVTSSTPASGLRVASLGTLDTTDGDQNLVADPVTSTCGENQTSDNGACVDVLVNSDLLPDYQPADVFGGADDPSNGTCFDTYECLVNGGDVEVDLAKCSVKLPVDVGAGINVGLRLGAGKTGICGDGGGECYVPLDAESDSGWRTQGSDIVLPRRVCQKLQETNDILGVVVTNVCAPKTSAIPPCGPWSGMGGAKASPDGGTPAPKDGGGPIRDGGGFVDGSIVDGGIPWYVISGGEAAITSLAVSTAGDTIYFATATGRIRQTSTGAVGPSDAPFLEPGVETGFGDGGIPARSMRLAYGSISVPNPVVAGTFLPTDMVIASDGGGSLKGLLPKTGTVNSLPNQFSSISSLSGYKGAIYAADLNAASSTLYRTVPSASAQTYPNMIAYGISGRVTNLVGTAGDHFHYIRGGTEQLSCLVNYTQGTCLSYRSPVDAELHSLTADDAYVFFWDGNNLLRLPQTGARDAFTLVPNEKDFGLLPKSLTDNGFDPQIAVDDNAYSGTRYVYYSTNTSVQRVPVFGGPIEDVAVGLSRPLALLVTATDVFWSTIDPNNVSVLYRRPKSSLGSVTTEDSGAPVGADSGSR